MEEWIIDRDGDYSVARASLFHAYFPSHSDEVVIMFCHKPRRSALLEEAVLMRCPSPCFSPLSQRVQLFS